MLNNRRDSATLRPCQTWKTTESQIVQPDLIQVWPVSSIEHSRLLLRGAASCLLYTLLLPKIT